MNKNELKELLKPIVKECVDESIKESIFSSGIISQLISEVILGVQPLLESKVEQPEEKSTNRFSEILKKTERSQSNDTRKQLAETIGKTSYGGVNVFQGIKETIPDETTSTGKPNAMQGIAANDPGVDITNLFDFNKANILAKGKKKK